MTDKERELFTQALKLITELDKDGLVLEMGLILEMREALAQLEQKLNDPPAYVEPPTSDYHNGWEEGFEAAKNLFKKESAPQNADPRLLLVRKDNCIALAQSEQEPEIVRRVRRYAGKRRESVGSPHINAKECIALANWIESIFAAPPRKPWVGLTVEDIRLMAHNDDKGNWSDLRFRSCWHNGYVDGVNAANVKLKDKNI